jgi:hypothetical protein
VRRRRAAALAAAATLVTLAAVWPITPGAAEESSALTAIARADAFRVAVNTTGTTASEVTDTSGPSAQAEVDSLGTSVGFAALPYPGDTAATSPGLVLSIVGPQLGLPSTPVPAYPLVARSQYPGQPQGRVSEGLVTLTAKSAEQSSEGHAAGAGADSGGNALGKATADAVVNVDDTGRVKVNSATAVESLTIGGVLRVGSLSAGAQAESPPGGKPTMKSTFSASGMTIAGAAVGISDKGLVLAGTDQPLPDGSALAKTLASAGIEVTYVAPVTGDTFVQSAGIEIRTTQGTSPSVTVTYSLGRARAELVGAASPVSSEAGGPALTADPALTGGAPPPPATASGTGGPLAAQVEGPSAAPGAASITRAVGAAAGRAVPVSTTSPMSLYLVLVLGGLVAVGGSVLLRYFAVRLAWTS